MVQITEKLQYLQKKLPKKKNQTFFENSYDVQKAKLESFREPKDLLERSYFQYLSQMYNVSFFMRMSQNILAIPILVYYLAKIYNKEKASDVKASKTAVFLREGINKDLLPESLINEYLNIIECPLNGKIYFNYVDKIFFLKNLLKYLKSPFFVLKCLLKMGIYSYVIQNYKPKAIITHNEYSFTSSFLTKYCNEMMVEHINIMHGEKLFDIRDSFVKFDRFYVWDKHYVDLFIKMRADKKQFYIEIPRRLNSSAEIKKDFKYELTYYLAGGDDITLNSLARNLKNTIIPINKICIRYHPRYSKIEQIESIFHEFTIQDPFKITIEESLSMTKYVASLYSTVIFEGYLIKKEIVLDNITDSDKYNKLKSLSYIMIFKEHILLSSFLK